MAQTPQRPDRRNRRGASGTPPRAAAQAAGEPPRIAGRDSTAGQADASGEAATEAQRRGEVAIAEAVKQTLQASAGMARTAQEAEARTEAAWQAGTDLVHRSHGEAPEAAPTDAAATGYALMPSAIPAGMLFGMPQAFAGLLNDMLQTHLRLGQDMLRLTNPLMLIEMQQQFLRSYLDLFLSGRHAPHGAAGTAGRTREPGPPEA